MFIGVAQACGAAAASPRALLIYYADETTPDSITSANDQALLSILAQSRSRLAVAIARAVVTDARDFPRAVSADVQALAAASQGDDFDLAVFTNALALQHRYWLHRAGSHEFEPQPLPYAAGAPNVVLANSPLSRPEVFQAALNAVASHYDRGGARTVLITNAHGDGQMAMMPRVFADLSFAQAGDVLARLDAASPMAGTRPRWAAYQGVSKAAYWKILQTVGAAHSLTFTLVVRDACKSGVGTLGEAGLVPSDVGAVADTGEDNTRGFSDINYKAMFSSQRTQGDLATIVAAQVRKDGFYVHSRSAAWLEPAANFIRRFWSLTLCAPLVAWLAWFSLWLGRSGRRPRHGKDLPKGPDRPRDVDWVGRTQARQRRDNS